MSNPSSLSLSSWSLIRNGSEKRCKRPLTIHHSFHKLSHKFRLFLYGIAIIRYISVLIILTVIVSDMFLTTSQVKDISWFSWLWKQYMFTLIFHTVYDSVQLESKCASLPSEMTIGISVVCSALFSLNRVTLYITDFTFT